MKLVYTVAKYFPDTGGVQTVTQKQAEAFAASGHEVVIICGNKKDRCTEETHNGVKILRIDAFNKIIMNLGNKKQFRNLVKKECEDADILITVCLLSFATNWLLDMLKELRCHKILYLHGISDFGQLVLKQIGILQFVYRKARMLYWKCYYARRWNYLKEYQAVVHIHEKDGSLDYFRRHKYKNNYVVYNAVEDVLFDMKQHEDKSNYFLYVANYTNGKNQKELLRYFYEADLPCGLTLIGSENNAYYRNLLKQQKNLEKRYGKKDVEILHHVERSLTVEYIKNAMATVMTSKAELFPITILETMAVGNPFICSDVGVVSDLPGGIIYHNPGELIEALRTLYENKEYRTVLREAGNAYAKEHLTMRKHMADMNKILQNVQDGIKERETCVE